MEESQLFDQFLIQEYFKIVDIIGNFDQRLLTIKGWGVTLSLAALAFGFQDQHYGLFLVAAVSSLAFWLIEYATKRHQVRFYVRMREIEVYMYELYIEREARGISTPLIDWSWRVAGQLLAGKPLQPDYEKPRKYDKLEWYRILWILPHMSLPHIFGLVIGGVLFTLGVLGILNMPL